MEKQIIRFPVRSTYRNVKDKEESSQKCVAAVGRKRKPPRLTPDRRSHVNTEKVHVHYLASVEESSQTVPNRRDINHQICLYHAMLCGQEQVSCAHALSQMKPHEKQHYLSSCVALHYATKQPKIQRRGKQLLHSGGIFFKKKKRQTLREHNGRTRVQQQQADSTQKLGCLAPLHSGNQGETKQVLFLSHASGFQPER